MQDAPEVVVERLRGMSTGPIFQIQLHRQDHAGSLLPESATCLLDSGATVSYIQKSLVETFRSDLNQGDLVTSRNVIKFGSGDPQLATELVIFRIKGDYHGYYVDECLPFIILDTTEFQAIVGWREISRKGVLWTILEQMAADARLEITLGGNKDSLLHVKANLMNRAG